MKTWQALLALAVMTAGAAMYSLSVYPSLPEQIPTHLDLYGRVDGWGPKNLALWLMPGTAVLFALLMIGLPWLSPRNFAIDAFRGTFNYVMLISCALIVFIHILMLRVTLDSGMDVGRTLIIGCCLFFAATGNVLGKVRRNFWVGIRTPWTLASDAVWASTHRLAARLMVAAGLAGAVGMLLGMPVAVCLALLGAVLLVPAGHSLWISKRLHSGGDGAEPLT